MVKCTQEKYLEYDTHWIGNAGISTCVAVIVPQ